MKWLAYTGWFLIWFIIFSFVIVPLKPIAGAAGPPVVFAFWAGNGLFLIYGFTVLKKYIAVAKQSESTPRFSNGYHTLDLASRIFVFSALMLQSMALVRVTLLAFEGPKVQNQPFDQKSAVPVLRSSAIVDQNSVVPDVVDSSRSDAEAQFNMGVKYELGQGVSLDYAQAAQWYRKAADQGYAYAQSNLGTMYYEGRGVPQDYAQAANWFHRAADQRLAPAQSTLGAMYANGIGVPQDYVQALRWCRKAADQGNADAQYGLGQLYFEGHGVPQNDTQAVQWYRKAADQGHALAQGNLAAMYDKGQGVPKDGAQAVKWFRKAADQGNANAQYNLGVMYNVGRGVPRGYAQAARWFRKAADQGHADAQGSLGYMYDVGHGVPKNLVQAMSWYVIAKASGSALVNLDAIDYNLQLVEAKATPTQIAEAQRVAREWWSAHRPGN